MNLLVTVDRNYLAPLRVMLCSLFSNNPEEAFDVYLMSGDLQGPERDELARYCAAFGARMIDVEIDGALFERAPVTRYYSKAMYYRLLAAQLLPDGLDRILYLDPDILVINSVRALYGAPLEDALFAAAMHKGLVNISAPVNKIRLAQEESEGYFNSGVLLMNLAAMRESVSEQDIFSYVEKNKALLIMPDQDILNGLYGARIMAIDESLWNYNAHRYSEYLLSSKGKKDMAWVMENTAILHFCGKDKPWRQAYRGRFLALYRHYEALTARRERALKPVQGEA